MTHSSPEEQLRGITDPEENRIELAEQVVTLRTKGFMILHQAQSRLGVERWAAKRTTPNAVVFRDNEAAQVGDERSMALADFGHRGLLVRFYGHYGKMEALEYLLLSNDEPLYFAAKEQTGRRPVFKAYNPIQESELKAVEDRGSLLPFATAEALEVFWQPLEDSIQLQKEREIAASEIARLTFQASEQHQIDT